jgi:hypothetical protein
LFSTKKDRFVTNYNSNRKTPLAIIQHTSQGYNPSAWRVYLKDKAPEIVSFFYETSMPTTLITDSSHYTSVLDLAMKAKMLERVMCPRVHFIRYFMDDFGMIFRTFTSKFIAKSEVVLQNFIQK